MSARTLSLPVWCLSLLLLSSGKGRCSPPPDPDLSYHEKLLRAAQVATDGPGLLAFFRARSFSAEVKARLAANVRQLGADSFRARERAEQSLARAGRVALPLLRPAAGDPDPEVRLRTGRILAAIKLNSDAVLVVSAARLLAACRPPGTVQALLDYLSLAEDPFAIDAVQDALTAVGVRGGKADRVLLAALHDPDPSRRAAAALAVANAGPEQRSAVRPLLADRDITVRLAAALGLLRAGDAAAVPPLLALLTDAPPALAGQAEDLLCQFAGETAPLVRLAGAGVTRGECRAAWGEWWKANAARSDGKRRSLTKPPLGLTLVCEIDDSGGGQVFECAGDSQARWTLSMSFAVDAQVLAGNRVLTADCNGRRVVELDIHGKELWKYACDGPVAVQRLANGNTFIATKYELLEVTHDGKKVYGHTRTEQVQSARKQPNGHIVCVQRNGVLVELDAGGREVLSLTLGGMKNNAGVQALPAGRFLVVRSAANEVTEVDRGGKVCWRLSVRNPASAVRLPNGNTLVASYQDRCVYEFNRAGKEVWKRTTAGVPLCVCRR